LLDIYEKEKEREGDMERDRERDTDRERETERQRESKIETERQRQRQRETKGERERERERESTHDVPYHQTIPPPPSAATFKDGCLESLGPASLNPCHQQNYLPSCPKLLALLHAGGVYVLLLWSLDPSFLLGCGNGHNLVSVQPHAHLWVGILCSPFTNLC
jgi:hypothetical protein